MKKTPRPLTRPTQMPCAIALVLSAALALGGCCGACGDMAEQIKNNAQGKKADKADEPAPPKKDKAPEEVPEEAPEAPKYGSRDGTRVIAKYRARLGQSDHIDGQPGPTETAARTIRQDRATFHAGKSIDNDDKTDPIFSDPDMQEDLENMALELLSIPANREIRRTIVKFCPLVRVTVKEDRDGQRTLRITILERGLPAD